jgi:CDP-glycerol glycerophosphotransferase (TagB/SpsB family)
MIDCDYAFYSGIQNWAYNKWYQNAAWLDLYENESTYNLSCKEKDNRGINSVITGLPIVDEFCHAEYPSPWKTQSTPCKKIIWAPHWTITEHSSVMPPYSHFLEMADFMLQFAKANIGKMQFAFKPHPSLKKELYKHPDWGKAKTDTYYQIWNDGQNTQLELGEYVSLFMTSDALVHDSSSFCCEYMLTGKPVLFMVKNEEHQVSLLNEMARSVFYAQYLGYSMSDLEQFLEKQVMRSKDPKKEERAKVTARYLLTPHGKTAAENIIQSILGD